MYTAQDFKKASRAGVPVAATISFGFFAEGDGRDWCAALRDGGDFGYRLLQQVAILYETLMPCRPSTVVRLPWLRAPKW